MSNEKRKEKRKKSNVTYPIVVLSRFDSLQQLFSLFTFHSFHFSLVTYYLLPDNAASLTAAVFSFLLHNIYFYIMCKGKICQRK
jgi:hypothetical protein